MRVENTSERAYEINYKPHKDAPLQTFIIPRGRNGESQNENGAAEVPDAIVAELLTKDPVVAAWFDSGHLIAKGRSGRKRVTVQDDPEEQEKLRAANQAAEEKRVADEKAKADKEDADLRERQAKEKEVNDRRNATAAAEQQEKHHGGKHKS